MMLTNPSNLVAKAKATIRECSVNDVRDCRDSGTILLDVREPAEFGRGHIPGAHHLPRGMLEFEVHGLIEKVRTDEVSQEDQDIVLYCGTGGRSALAAETMAALGYRNVRSLAGGIVAWNQAGLPVATP
jgi:rhodanese-related sulfurtransferase